MSIQLRSLDLPIYGQKKVIGEIETALHGFIETALREKRLLLADLMRISQVEIDQLVEIQSPKAMFSEIESRATVAEEVVRSRVFEIRSTQSAPSTPAVGAAHDTEETADLIRDGEIRRCFLSTLKSAKQRVLIVSPLMNEQIVDNEVLEILKTLAAKRVITLLGWGISRTQVEEKTPPTERLINKLAQIITPEGLPAAIVLWLGNQHSKDVIVDYAIHVCGSYNWLSYRGNDLPRGASTYRITIPEPIKRAAGSIEQLFVESAQAEFDDWLGKEANTNDLARLISVWIGSGQFTEAYRHVLHATQNANPKTISLLVPLCQAASEALYGATPDTQVELLKAIGEFGLADSQAQSSSNGESAIFSGMNKADKKALVKSIQNLMKRLAENDPTKTQQIKETFFVFWNSMGITVGNSSRNST
ncbi:MAG: hypothetical protein HY866_07580 [Chloroflexi bacterium]|nr:hypothetical protein [Chloroflexota bacterium]